MIEKSDFLKNFAPAQAPSELIGLFDFDSSVAKDNYFSNGFELAVCGKYMLKTYSEDKRFLDSIIEFAQADGTDSMYAIWHRDSTESLSNSPVVVFGSEGGYHVVADNLQGLFQLLAYDVEPMISWDGVDYYKDDADHTPSVYHAPYKSWLAENYGMTTFDDPGTILERAHEKHGDAFSDWVQQFYNE